MCLLTKRFFPKVALNDIPVYKIMYKLQDKLYSSPCRGYLYTLGIAEKITVFKMFSFTRVSGEWEHIKGFHSFTSFEIANFVANPHKGHIILKGYIPKGSFYWDGYKLDVAVSNKIVLTEEICE